jgi:hypothetical protein
MRKYLLKWAGLPPNGLSASSTVNSIRSIRDLTQPGRYRFLLAVAATVAGAALCCDTANARPPGHYT